ncbi:hypothetical protein NPIL_294241 [Nephila pilipes]|uniref:Uncharacterized protein n=1 Tax=Nephila pilipes TaxID=299642 RepID=A0A8X6T0N3_NEPPI|nr:hypothetical protein NPIL_294241 [Nephila pilipes]
MAKSKDFILSLDWKRLEYFSLTDEEILKQGGKRRLKHPTPPLSYSGCAVSELHSLERVQIQAIRQLYHCTAAPYRTIQNQIKAMNAVSNHITGLYLSSHSLIHLLYFNLLK